MLDLWKWERVLDGNEVTQPTNLAGNIKTSGLIYPSACVNFEPVAGKNKTGALSITIEWRGLTKLRDGIKTPDHECRQISSQNPIAEQFGFLPTLLVMWLCQ